MRKLVKLSLVAAVAVSGLTTVNAASLEEAIKNVDVSGQFHYRLQDKDSAGSTINTDNDIEIGVKVPVTDNITAVFKIDNAPNNTELKSIFISTKLANHINGSGDRIYKGNAQSILRI